MKRTGILTIVSLILYLFRSLICGLLIGTMHVNEVLAEGLSIFVVLAVIFFMIRGKERLTYFGICGWEGDGFLKANFFLFFCAACQSAVCIFRCRDRCNAGYFGQHFYRGDGGTDF